MRKPLHHDRLRFYQIWFKPENNLYNEIWLIIDPIMWSIADSKTRPNQLTEDIRRDMLLELAIRFKKKLKVKKRGSKIYMYLRHFVWGSVFDKIWAETSDQISSGVSPHPRHLILTHIMDQLKERNTT